MSDLMHVYVDSQSFVSDLPSLVSSLFISSCLSFTLCDLSAHSSPSLDWTLDLAKPLI
jgi:hypothetical protein